MARYDLVVLGSGPAGRRAAVQAAKLGRSGLGVDNRQRVGGGSVHTGTIPSKTLRETALNLSGWRERGFYGQSYRAKAEICAADLAGRLGKTLQHESGVLEHQFARNEVTTMIGWGRFLDSHRIAVCQSTGEDAAHEVVEADRVLIAVGTVPFRPAHIPFNGSTVLDSDDFIMAPRLPKSLAVMGAGVIGLEYATIFSALDVPVTLIEPRGSYLDFMDREIVEHLTYLLRDRGMALKLSSEVSAIRFAPDGAPVCLLEGGRQVAADMVLYAAGR
ncbi:MAG TPA: FAD-dependent oxidoreductase, partial [Novosphingobium sp.]|nr:FAD-dependent oxidoreductase [Novosphingobium sp.]